jgi:hypothetical protein
MNDLAKPVKVKATVMWCFHNKLESLGLDVRKREDKPEKGFFITCKSTVPMKVFDASGNDLNTVAIGNGSTATAVVGAYEWAWKNKKGVSATLTKLVVEDLVAYDAAEAEEAADEVL